jgi:tRNA-dihydrouridine synthase A
MYIYIYIYINIVSSQGGVNRFQIHARKALLGVSTMGNRDIPPLQYERVYKLIRDFPHINFEINGAINSPQEVRSHFDKSENLKGVMVGRACINHPYMWINTDKLIYNDMHQITLTRGEILEQYADYCELISAKKEDLNSKKITSKLLLAPIYNLFTGEQYCETFRRDLSKMASRVNSPALILRYVTYMLNFLFIYVLMFIG